MRKWRQKIPIPALLLFMAIGVSTVLLAASLADRDKPSSEVAVESAGNVEESVGASGQNDSSPRQPLILPPGSSDSETTYTGTAGMETLFVSADGTPGPDTGDSPPEAPADDSVVTLWQDRDDDSYNSGDGTGPITGRVTDPWGNGVPGVEVYLDYAPQYCYKGCAGYYEPAAVSDSLGYYSAWRTSYHSYSDNGDPNGGDAILFGQPGLTAFSAGPELTGSHTVYFSGQVGGYQTSEWYNNKRLNNRGYYFSSPEDSAFIAAGSSGVDAVLVPDGTIVGHIPGDRANQMKIIAFRADSPEPADTNAYSAVAYVSESDFAFDGLPPGSYKLVAVPDVSGAPPLDYLCTWFKLSRSWETARTVTVGPGQRVSLDFQLLEPQPDGSALRGNFYIENMPPRTGTVLTLVDADNPSRVVAQKTVTYADFTFKFSSLPKSDYKLKCTLPGSGHTIWYKQNYDLFSDEPGIDEADVISAGPDMVQNPIIFNVYPYGAVVSGSVKFQDGSPLVDEVVFARMRISEGGPVSVYRTAYTSSDTGRYSFGSDADDPDCIFCNLGWDRLPSGSYQLCVTDWPSGVEYCNPEIQTVDWYDNRTGVDITVPNDFGTPFEVNGRVTTPDGAGVAGATVRLDAAFSTRPQVNVLTDADGYYRIERTDGLQPAAYNVYAIVNGVSHKRVPDDGYIYVSRRQALENIDIVLPENVVTDGYSY